MSSTFGRGCRNWNPDRDKEHIDWTRKFHEAMQPYTTDEVAMNFLTEDESEERDRKSVV